MVWTSLLKSAPWGEIMKAASRVPDLVRGLRTGGSDAAPAPATSTPVPDAERLQAELVRIDQNVDRLRAYSEQQATAVAVTMRQMSVRVSRLTWIASGALLLAMDAIVIPLIR